MHDHVRREPWIHLYAVFVSDSRRRYRVQDRFYSHRRFFHGDNLNFTRQLVRDPNTGHFTLTRTHCLNGNFRRINGQVLFGISFENERGASREMAIILERKSYQITKIALCVSVSAHWKRCRQSPRCLLTSRKRQTRGRDLTRRRSFEKRCPHTVRKVVFLEPVFHTSRELSGFESLRR